MTDFWLGDTGYGPYLARLRRKGARMASKAREAVIDPLFNAISFLTSFGDLLRVGGDDQVRNVGHHVVGGDRCTDPE